LEEVLYYCKLHQWLFAYRDQVEKIIGILSESKHRVRKERFCSSSFHCQEILGREIERGKKGEYKQLGKRVRETAVGER
jgi:hypothetical protein